jgi:putative transposase
MQVFFSEDDYRNYRRILATKARQHDLSIWAYCLMPNHVHLIAVPSCPQGLARPLGEAHRHYALHVNRRNGWTGHLWQERFRSFAMDEFHLVAAIRYVLLNPVRAGLVETAAAWPYSSARAHLRGTPDELTDTEPAARCVGDWQVLLGCDSGADGAEMFRRHTRVGRPLGSESFLDDLERSTGRPVRPQKRGRKAYRALATEQ